MTLLRSFFEQEVDKQIETFLSVSSFDFCVVHKSFLLAFIGPAHQRKIWKSFYTGDVSNSRIEFSLCFSFLLAFSGADKCKFPTPRRGNTSALCDVLNIVVDSLVYIKLDFAIKKIQKNVFNGYDPFML